MLPKILNLIKTHQHSIFLGFCILLIALISFNLGKISGVEKKTITINDTGTSSSQLDANIYKATSKPATSPSKSSTIVTPKATPKPLQVVVSKASTSKKYHFTWCSGAQRIKPENQIWFNTEAEAVAAGYTLAGNCTK